MVSILAWVRDYLVSRRAHQFRTEVEVSQNNNVAY